MIAAYVILLRLLRESNWKHTVYTQVYKPNQLEFQLSQMCLFSVVFPVDELKAEVY